MKNSLNRFKNAEQLIGEVLHDNPETREDDLELIFKVWDKQGAIIPDTIKTLLRKCYSPETIRRWRQKYNENGLYKPSKDTQDKRKQLQMEYRKELRQPKYIYDCKRQVFMQV
jgi:transposase